MRGLRLLTGGAMTTGWSGMLYARLAPAAVVSSQHQGQLLGVVRPNHSVRGLAIIYKMRQG